MDDYALVLNAGSSSLKFCVLPAAEEQNLASGSAWTDRGHRDIASSISQRMLRVQASPTRH